MGPVSLFFFNEETEDQTENNIASGLAEYRNKDPIDSKLLGQYHHAHSNRTTYEVLGNYLNNKENGLCLKPFIVCHRRSEISSLGKDFTLLVM